MDRHVLDLETLLKIPCVDPDEGFDISPDGSQAAFSWNRSGRWEVYVAFLDGSAPPRQVTTGPGAKFAPRWSPDGRCLVYGVDLDGGELFDLWVCDLTTSKQINVTPDTADSILPHCCWSPDGRRIAFTSDRAGRFDTYVMAAPGGTGIRPARVLHLPYPDWRARWSPDGSWLAVVADTIGQDQDTFIVSPDGGEPRCLADAGGPLRAKDACWAPDSERLAFSSDRGGQFDVGIFHLPTGQIDWATEGKGDKEYPAWSPDGRHLAYILSQGPKNCLAVLELGQDAPVTYAVEPGVHYWPRFTPDGRHVAFVFDNPRHPDDLWLLSLADGALRQLTFSLPSGMDWRQLILPVEIRYPSLDGETVPALLYRPAHAGPPPPAVVYVHGGPDWLAQVTWDPLVQHMVSRGWVVLAPNYRGSTGYGRGWQVANRFDLGGGDTGDIVAGADYLVREGLVDPKRIAVTGRSYGGYLTMTSLTHYPDRWAAGSAVVPFVNWFTAHVNSRDDLQHWDLENFGHPEEDRGLYHERSPLFFLERVAAPVQLIGGAHDPRCPVSEATQAHDRLVELGVPCELTLYPDEGHSFLKIENVVDAKTRRAAFLARVLEATDTPTGGGELPGAEHPRTAAG